MKKVLLCLSFLMLVLFSCTEQQGAFICKPCDLSCDKLTFDQPGTCPHCNMELIKKSEWIDESTLIINDIDIKTGSGVFLVEGGASRKEKQLKIYYHKPKNYSPKSKVLIVIPGAGRNADSYRDAWVQESEQHGVLILSPLYSEDFYPFEAYHLGGVIENSNIRSIINFADDSNEAYLNEEAFTYDLIEERKEWIFADLDRIFNLVVNSLESPQTKYDVFGHSAGGQILHRFAVLNPQFQADRIIAANSGFYTLPTTAFDYPFGIRNLSIEDTVLTSAFSNKLVLLIGELDNENEQGGTLLRSISADQQGLHRLARAKYFFAESKQKAKGIDASFNWTLNIVPNVGHDHEAMGNAAAQLLYE